MGENPYNVRALHGSITNLLLTEFPEKAKGLLLSIYISLLKCLLTWNKDLQLMRKKREKKMNQNHICVFLNFY